MNMVIGLDNHVFFGSNRDIMGIYWECHGDLPSGNLLHTEAMADLVR